MPDDTAFFSIAAALLPTVMLAGVLSDKLKPPKAKSDTARPVFWVTWDELATRLVWAREEGYTTAKARRANGWVDRPLLPSEQARLVGDATRLSLARARDEALNAAELAD